MASLRESLAAVEAAVARLDREVTNLLRPGLPAGTVVAALALRQLSVSDRHDSVYRWHDGTETATDAVLSDLWLVPGFYLLSLADALADYDRCVVSDRWDASWFPVFSNGGGDFLAVDLSSGQVSEAVRHFRIEEDEHPIEYESLTAMFATFAAAYEQRIFFVDSRGDLEVDDEAFASLAGRLNPTVAASWTT